MGSSLFLATAPWRTRESSEAKGKPPGRGHRTRGGKAAARRAVLECDARLVSGVARCGSRPDRRNAKPVPAEWNAAGAEGQHRYRRTADHVCLSDSGRLSLSL